ncbi:hypothetical protein ACQP2X_11555 [Actinoplanes sp. CA-131856]
MGMHLGRRVGAVLAAAVAVVGLAAAPAAAETKANFGPFNSSTDCGRSVYLSTFEVKLWACARKASGATKTGIAVQNYSDSSVYVEVYFTRFWTFQSSQASTMIDQWTGDPLIFGPIGMQLPANQTKVIYDDRFWQGLEHLCNENEGCRYDGAKGYANIFTSSANGARSEHSASAYSPLQSSKVQCTDGPTITNWPNTGKCDQYR